LPSPSLASYDLPRRLDIPEGNAWPGCPIRSARWRPTPRRSALAEKVGDLGEYLRFDSTLPGDIRELAILATLPPRYAAPMRLVQHVLAYESIPPALQEQMQREVGIRGVMELVTLAGQYRLIAGVLFAFDTPLPDGTPAAF
jgi:hypothetical protein